VEQSSGGPLKFEIIFKIFAKIELERQKSGRILEFFDAVRLKSREASRCESVAFS